MIIKFLVLASSYKHGGRCVAGIDLTNEKLIRLISRDESTNFAIPKEECFINERPLAPLDIIEVDVEEKAPTLGAQNENYYVGLPLVKKFIGIGEEKDIKKYKFNSDKSPYPYDTKEGTLSRGAYFHKDYSLCLIRAYSLVFKSTTNAEGKSKTKVDFDVYKYNSEAVRLEDYSVTDPQYCIFDGQNRMNRQSLGKAWLLISVAPDDDFGAYSKFVAGIIDVSK